MPAREETQLAAAVAAALVAAGYRPAAGGETVHPVQGPPCRSVWTVAGRQMAHRRSQLANERRRGRLKWLK